MTQDNNYDGLEEKLDAAINEAFAGLTEKASWVPYEGDRGGVGWRNTESDTVIYDDEPPGGTPEGIPDSLDEMQEQIESGELSVDDIERAVAGGRRPRRGPGGRRRTGRRRRRGVRTRH